MKDWLQTKYGMEAAASRPTQKHYRHVLVFLRDSGEVCFSTTKGLQQLLEEGRVDSYILDGKSFFVKQENTVNEVLPEIDS